MMESMRCQILSSEAWGDGSPSLRAGAIAWCVVAAGGSMLSLGRLNTAPEAHMSLLLADALQGGDLLRPPLGLPAADGSGRPGVS